MNKQVYTIGLPRAMLFYRFEALWRAFFEELGMKVLISPPTDKEILAQGTALAIDEMCLSAKIFFGHVQALLGKCDFILVPRVSNTGRNLEYCSRFAAMYDVCRNVFRDHRQIFLGYDLDVMAGRDEEHALISLGAALGIAEKDARRAYRRAAAAQRRQERTELRLQEPLYRAEGIKLLVVGHSYVVRDTYMGRPVLDFLKASGVTVLRADITDRAAAAKRGLALSPTCKWEVSRELLGTILQRKEQVDGLVLLSAFPCGPDSMVNELIVRRVKGIPILNLVLDAQTGAAGLETRLESFIDIIRFKEGVL